MLTILMTNQILILHVHNSSHTAAINETRLLAMKPQFSKMTNLFYLLQLVLVHSQLGIKNMNITMC